MPRIDQATEEMAVDIVARTEEATGGIDEAFKYLRGISLLLINKKGFNVIVRRCRRMAVARAFNGKNQKEIARKLGISEVTVRNDIRGYYNRKKR